MIFWEPILKQEMGFESNSTIIESQKLSYWNYFSYNIFMLYSLEFLYKYWAKLYHISERYSSYTFTLTNNIVYYGVCSKSYNDTM